jgi:hypothetical protein
MVDHTIDLHDMFALAQIVSTPDGLRAFLTTPQPRFEGATALQLIEIGRTADILAALAEDDEGLGYETRCRLPAARRT